MKEQQGSTDAQLSRRNFLEKSTTVGLVTASTTIIRPFQLRGAGREVLRAGLIGCGGRGTAAVRDLLSADDRVELVAMADLFEDRLERSLRRLNDPNYVSRHAGSIVERDGQKHVLTKEELAKSIPARIKVDAEHRFLGFDAYRKLIGSDVDIVLLATPPGYRPFHFEAAIAANKHVFAEKPFGTDPVNMRRFMKAARELEIKRLTVVSGAQRRFSKAYRETIQRIQDGEIGEIVAAYAYWQGGPVIFHRKRNPKWTDMEWQHRQWYSFVWICGDQIVEQHIHNIDVINWLLGMHPERVTAQGGAAWRPRDEIHGNIYDHISAEFIYPNGLRLSSHCRQYPRQPGIFRRVGEWVVGTKGRSNCRDMGEAGNSPYLDEHIALVKSIRGDGPYVNHAMAVAESTMACIMAREAAYSGREITWNEIMMSELDLFPKNLSWDAKVEIPPLPVPGQYKFI